MNNGMKGTRQEKINFRSSNIKTLFEDPKIRKKLQRAGSGGIQAKFEKDASKSNTKRQEGNSYFSKTRLLESLAAYNEAILNASTAQELAVCLANRSAVLFDLRAYELALQDILTAENDYSQQLLWKIQFRKLKIYHYLKQDEKVLETQKQIETSVQSTQKLHELQLAIKDFLASSIAHKNQSSSIIKKFEGNFQTLANIAENPEFAGASTNARINYEKSAGRFVTATKNLKRGDVLFVEDPYVSVLMPEFEGVLCHYCHFELKIDRNGQAQYFIPCRKCTQVKYCGPECEDVAWKEFHEHECLHMDYLESTGIAHLSLRIVLTAGTNTVLQTIEKEFSMDNFEVFSKSGSKYEQIFSLVDNMELMKSEDLSLYEFTAALLLHYLRETTTFLCGLSDEEVYKIGGAIFHHTCQLICNAHAISSFKYNFNDEDKGIVSDEKAPLDYEQVRIASAIFPSSSLMNHSCAPAIANCFLNGRKLIVRLALDVPEGGEIFNCYGPDFRRMPLKTRKESLLNQYLFNCCCTICKKEEEEGRNYSDLFISFKCPYCNGPILPKIPDQPGSNIGQINSICFNCQKKHDLTEMIKGQLNTQKIMEKVTDEFGDEFSEIDHQESIEFLEYIYNKRKSFLYEFNSEIGEVCDLLGKSYYLTGNFEEAEKYLKESLTIVQRKFGNTSIEYGLEMRKFYDVIVNNPKLDSDRLQVLKSEIDYVLKLYTFP